MANQNQAGLIGQSKSAPDIQREFTCEWVRRGAPGLERYEGTAQVFASSMEIAIERARRQVAMHGCFRASEIEITKVTFRAGA